MERTHPMAEQPTAPNTAVSLGDRVIDAIARLVRAFTARRAGRPVPRLLSEMSGQTIVFIAMGMPVLIGSAAIALDVGMRWQERREIQNAVDAAVLAAAKGAGPDANLADIQARAETFLTSNGIDITDLHPAKFPFGRNPALAQLLADGSLWPANHRLPGRVDCSRSCQGWFRRSISSLMASF